MSVVQGYRPPTGASSFERREQEHRAEAHDSDDGHPTVNRQEAHVKSAGATTTVVGSGRFRSGSCSWASGADVGSPRWSVPVPAGASRRADQCSRWELARTAA
jgi:hypothetical protein